MGGGNRHLADMADGRGSPSSVNVRKNAMATIKAIESRSVHQIQSGQVIVDLTSVVKELVENSLDARATWLEIRFKKHGLHGIEVQDNGAGIPPDDFDTLARKHYTSKLARYEDLTRLQTFGFRGEALSSLCALSRLQITTARAEDGAVGRRLEFEPSGLLKSSSVVAAPKGTTVAVDALFARLPVRRKALEKNITREYGKVVSRLHAYACITLGVRFSVTNQMPQGRKIAVFATNANPTTKENLANLFGAKALAALVPLDLRFALAPTQRAATHDASPDAPAEIRLQGHVSRPVVGQGRQAPDRQMFFVNSRPCALPQVAKALNEVYRSFNLAQSPFVLANLVLDTSAYDVNVSPDKRSILLHEQTALVDGLKLALTELFEKTEQTVPQSHVWTQRQSSLNIPAIARPLATLNVSPNVDSNAEPEPSDDDDIPAAHPGAETDVAPAHPLRARPTEARPKHPASPQAPAPHRILHPREHPTRRQRPRRIRRPTRALPPPPPLHHPPLPRSAPPPPRAPSRSHTHTRVRAARRRRRRISASGTRRRARRCCWAAVVRGRRGGGAARMRMRRGRRR